MLTPQEVSSHAFPKAVMGGYNMSSVDEFLDELTEDYAALYKENAALKAKLKVLVEKVEDYRATEDAMRSTLLTAQKMADSIVKEAEAKRDRLAVQAESDARAKIGQLHAETVEAEERLKAGQRELAGFIASTRELCAREIAFLDRLPKLPLDAPAATPEAEERKEEETAGEIQQHIRAAFLAEAARAREASGEEAEASPAPESGAGESYSAAAAEDRYPAGNPFAGDAEDAEPEEPTRRLDLRELKFGRNYLDEDK